MKKLLSLVLALVMVLGCMSIPAFAATSVETSLITDSELQGIAAHTDTGLKLIGSKEAVYGTDYTITTNGSKTNDKSMCYVNILTSGWKIAGTVSDAFADIYMDIRIENDNEVEGFTVTLGDMSKKSAENLISLTVNLSNSKDVTIALDTAKALWLDMLSMYTANTETVKIVGNGKEIDTPSLIIMGNLCLDNVTVKAESATSFAALCMGELSLTGGAKLIAISTADSYAYGLYGMGTSVSASADSEIFLSGKGGAVCGVSAADLAFIEGWKASADVVDYADKGTMTAVATDAEVESAFLSTIKDSSPVTVAKTVYNEATPTGGDNEEESKSGSTDITAIKAEPELEYTIVIPTATELTEEAHKDVRLGGEEGKASIDVTTGNSKTNVYYTVDLANGTLTDGTNTITTTYAYAQGGDYSALTDETKVTVYKSGTVKDSTIQVTADETSWTAAPAGTYTASVVFNFGTEDAEAEAPAAVTAADVLTTGAQYKLKATNTQSGSIDYSFTYEKTETGFELIEILEANSDKTELYSPACLSSADGSNICFILGAGLTFTLDTSKNEYAFTGSDASKWTFTSFSVKSASGTEFTEVTLTPVVPK